MNRRTVLLILVPLLAAGLLAFQKAGGPVITFSDKDGAYDFGTVYDDATVQHDYLFKNNGNEPLIIENAMSSCGAVTPTWPKEPVMPGKSGMITILYDARHRPGPFHKTVVIRTNCRKADGSPQHEILYLKGIVVERNAGPVPSK